MSRMNEGRNSWLTEDELATACREFLVVNGYSVVPSMKFERGSSYESSVVGVKTENASEEILACYLCPRLERYEISLFGNLESALYSVMDSADDASLILATDAFSYFKVIANNELNVAVENLMGQGLFLLFLNNRSAHALFDNFESLARPVPVDS